MYTVIQQHMRCMYLLLNNIHAQQLLQGVQQTDVITAVYHFLGLAVYVSKVTTQHPFIWFLNEQIQSLKDIPLNIRNLQDN